LLYTDKFGTTALQIACGLTPDAKEKVTLVTWFLSEHADVRITLNWADVVGGHTALHCAASCNSNAVVRVLLAHGANPTLANKKGHTPARLARRYSRGIGTAELLEKAERAHAVHALGEWRPRSHVRFPRGYRVAMRTLVVLAKARTPAPEDASELRSHYPRACLDLLPEELLQYLFAYITAPHVPDVWTT
jgi:ankyrin repeat protein